MFGTVLELATEISIGFRLKRATERCRIQLFFVMQRMKDEPVSASEITKKENSYHLWEMNN